ncbi:MAG TPA: ATP-binding protein [Kaistiaceae bacterium]|nr:ATP-binding protein [Kaistiaceae bacterium]
MGKTGGREKRPHRPSFEALADDNWRLRESLEQHESLIEMHGDLVVRRDAGGRLVFVNDAVCETFGEKSETLLGTDWRPQVIEEGPEPETREQPRDIRLMTAAGPRWYAWLDMPARRPGDGVITLQSVGRDITDRKAVEAALRHARDEAEAASRAKSRFLATVSHEIRTPLNGILGMAALLSDTRLSAEQATYARAIETSGEALLSLIEDVLDFSRIEAGRLELAPTGFEPRRLAEEVGELLAPRAHGKGIEIASRVAPDVPEKLVGDAARLRQVLLNLAGNGIKFTEAGGVLVSVAVDSGDPADAERCRLVFEVRDTGVGIAEADAERLFEEFEQTDLGRRRGGTGLGLAISRRIVELMGGEMTLSSEPGKGSRFAFAIDLPVAAPSPEIETLLAGRRALVVARSAVEAPALAACLADAGAASEIVPTVADAVVRLRGEATAFDIALVENRIGHDAADDLATLRDVVPDLPAVVLIEPGARGELDRLKRQGYAGYLVRPIRARSAVALLDTVLDGPDWDKEDDLADERVAPRLPRKVESRHVLLAEDNEINTLLARSVLERQGHRVTAVADGAAALAVYREAFVPGEAEPGEPIDLVLMDLHMPELDGIGATRAIRALEAEHLLARVPIVALTANAQADERERALAAGLDDYATKPIDPDRLARLVETWTGTGRERALARAG